MRFEVLNVQWTADDETFGGGVHDVKKPTATFLRLLAGAEAAGAVKVLDAAGNRAKLNQHVETQAQSEKAYAKAQESGAWHHGNVQQFVVDTETRIAATPKEAAAPLHAQLDRAKTILGHLEKGASYDEAVTRTLNQESANG
jgi:hypothetical protein